MGGISKNCSFATNAVTRDCSLVEAVSRRDVLKAFAIATAGALGSSATSTALGAPSVGAASLRPAKLRCEYMTNPLGLDAKSPRLFWELVPSGAEIYALRQHAYQIIVASSRVAAMAGQGDLWDSGKVISDETIQIAYAGKPLTSRDQCFWRVRVWDQNDAASDYSDVAFWTMGLLKRDDWQGDWIGYDANEQVGFRSAADAPLVGFGAGKWIRLPNALWSRSHRIAPGVEGVRPGTVLFRKKFATLPGKSLKRAVIVASPDDAAMFFVNGQQVGEASRWEPAALLDITRAVTDGDNVVAMSIAQQDGYSPSAIGRVLLIYADGHEQEVPFDRTWRVTEQHDSGWMAKGLSDGHWAMAQAEKKPLWGTGCVAAEVYPPARHLRRKFSASKPVQRATLSITALGLFEPSLNGQRIGRDYLCPGWTDFHKRVHYVTYDVTSQIKPGDNALGVILGDGWFSGNIAWFGRRKYGGPPRLLAQLDIHYADGTMDTIATDEHWRAGTGPVYMQDIYAGCGRDSRKEISGWDTAAFDDSSWHNVNMGIGKSRRPVNPLIEALPNEPARITQEVAAKKLTQPKPGQWTFDLGQNIVGWVRLKVRGKPGQKIVVRHGEMQNPDGTLYAANVRSAMSTDVYYLKGGEETIEPMFTFHGFQHVEVRGLNYQPELGDVTGLVVHSDIHRTGDFSCSSPMVNKLYENIVWGQKGNHIWIPTDCPQRDERLGWTGDTQFFIPTGVMNFDIAAFFSNWLMTMCEDSQSQNGSFANVAPAVMGKNGVTAWGDAALICPYHIYKTFGDTRIIEQHFDAMMRYFKYPESLTHNDIMTATGFGDWLNLGGSASWQVIGTTYYAMLSEMVAEMATAIGREAEAEQLYAKSHALKAAFAKKLLRPDGTILNSSQTGFALAFTTGCIPGGMKKKAADQFVADIQRRNWHLATGFIGTPRLLPALGLANRDDAAYKLLLQLAYPSWLFQVKTGHSTTMWERWDGWTPNKGFESIGMNSFNHYAFGSVGQYLYQNIGGITTDGAGYKQINIRPTPGKGLFWAKCSYDSVRGAIESSWKRTGRRLMLEVVVPPNTTATVYVPTALDKAVTVTLGAKHAKLLPSRESFGAAMQRVRFSVPSGRYTFESEV
ncbi:MAG: family 78 glycoside hydrolase catalytic domain [Phycisphaerales bacterium]|nr:family 78 glycoside hydrolase catalytic domain [Phycisphaerales bacterium]